MHLIASHGLFNEIANKKDTPLHKCEMKGSVFDFSKPNPCISPSHDLSPCICAYYITYRSVDGMFYVWKLWRKHVYVHIKVRSIYARLQQHGGKHLKIAQYWFCSLQNTNHSLFVSKCSVVVTMKLEMASKNNNNNNRRIEIKTNWNNIFWFQNRRHPPRVGFLHNWKHAVFWAIEGLIIG